MFFTAITFIAAFLIEAIGTVVSVIGLSTLFGANPIIIALAVALDIGKLVVVALLYKYWGELNRLMKVYGLLAACVTMIITSAGAAGYLSAEFQKAMVGTQEVSLKVDLLKEEQARLQKRKEQIDQQVASLPERFSATQRVRMINQFKTEQTAITSRLAEIDKELPTLKVTQINTEAKAGPILYISKAFGISIEEAVKWVILLIIFVFDPLAVFLIVAGNFLLDRHRKDTAPPSEPPAAEPSPAPSSNDEVRPVPETLASSTPIFTIMEPTNPPPVKNDGDDVVNSHEPRCEDDGPVARTYDVEPDPEARPPIEEAPGEVDEGQEGPVARTYQEEPEPEVRPPVEVEEPVSAEPTPPTDSEPNEITRSTLGMVKPDPSVKMVDTGEIGYKTGIYKTGFYRPGS